MAARSLAALAVLLAAGPAGAQPNRALSIVVDHYGAWLARVGEPVRDPEATMLALALHDIDPGTLEPSDRETWDVLEQNLATATPATLVEVEPYERALVRHSMRGTTTESLEALGWRELARAEAELVRSSPGALSARAVLDSIRAGRLTPDDVARRARTLQRRARAGVARAFRTLPEAARIALIRQRRAHAHVFDGSPAIYFARRGRHRPGVFGLRAGVDGVAADELEVLVFHETFPGHHLEARTPRQETRVDCEACTAYTEGWATYAESLADELGLFADEAARRGRWSFWAWRSARAVVDTGIHARGWSDAKAASFLREHTALSEEVIATELQRAHEVPGHGVSYIAGATAIARIRREAEDALGARFDLRAFHATVLGRGPVPLGTLERRVRAWARTIAGSAIGS